MKIKKVDDVLLIGSDVDKFEELINYYNAEIMPDDTFIGQADLARKLLREAVRREYYDKIWKGNRM